MELFLDFVFTITFSLIASFFFAKVLSAATTDDPQPDFTENKTADDSRDYNSETDEKTGLASESIDDQRFELLNTKVEKKEGKSSDRVEKTETDMGVDEKEEIEITKNDKNMEEEDEEDDDDWEGIERSEIEKLFGAAVALVGKISSKLSSDLKLQLYGLHQVAMEGPCYLPQPLPFMVSARAKWNAWQQLGTMNQEAAMEQYINLVSTTIPGWMEHTLGDDVKHDFTQHNDADLNPELGNDQWGVVERSLDERMPRDEGRDRTVKVGVADKF